MSSDSNIDTNIPPPRLEELKELRIRMDKAFEKLKENPMDLQTREEFTKLFNKWVIDFKKWMDDAPFWVET